jgi:hypothetical protein
LLVKIARWAFFAVLVSLLPLVYSYENLLVKSQTATLAKVLGNGELLIIVWALCAGAIGELFGGTTNYRVAKIVAGGLTLLVLIFSALLFASVAEARVSGIPLDELNLVATSIRLLIFGLICCASCVALSET